MKTADIWNELGNTYFKTGELEKAVEAFEKAVDLQPQSGWPYSDLALAYVEQGRFSEAILLYQKSLILFTSKQDQALTWRRLGKVFDHLNEYGKAFQAYKKADELSSEQVLLYCCSEQPGDNALLKQESNQVFESQIEIKNTAQLFSGAVFVSPGVPVAKSVEVSSHQGTIKKNHTEGITRKAENKIENKAHVWNELGCFLFKAGAYENAIDAFMKAIELEPAYGLPYSNLGMVQKTLGKYADAVQLYEKSLNLFSQNKDKSMTWTRLGDAYRQLGHYEQAMAAYQLADELNQSDTVPLQECRSMSLELIIPRQSQVRAEDELDDLMMSIRAHGIIQPLLVCPAKNIPGKYLLITGRRRLEAARRIGLLEVPVIIRRANDQEILEISINENIHTAAVSPFEIANWYRKMMNEFDLSVEEIATSVGRSRFSVANSMKILDQPANDRQALQEFERFQTGSLFKPALAEDSPMITLSADQRFDQQSDAWSTEEEHDSELRVRQNLSASLWYNEADGESDVEQSDLDEQPEPTTLLERARNVLKCNPHFKRFWTNSSYRA